MAQQKNPQEDFGDVDTKQPAGQQKQKQDQGQAQRNTPTGPWESEKDPERQEKPGSREGGPARHGGPMGGENDDESESEGKR